MPGKPEDLFLFFQSIRWKKVRERSLLSAAVVLGSAWNQRGKEVTLSEGCVNKLQIPKSSGGLVVVVVVVVVLLSEKTYIAACLAGVQISVCERFEAVRAGEESLLHRASSPSCAPLQLAGWPNACYTS